MARVLLAEDNEQICEFLSKRLDRRGHEVVLAHDGEAALHSARAGAPDAVILDMSAPVIDGWTVAGILKRDPQTRQIPIIALTLESDAAEGEKALQAGADAFHPKPIDTTRLFEQIESLLAARAAG